MINLEFNFEEFEQILNKLEALNYSLESDSAIYRLK